MAEGFESAFLRGDRYSHEVTHQQKGTEDTQARGCETYLKKKTFQTCGALAIIQLLAPLRSTVSLTYSHKDIALWNGKAGSELGMTEGFPMEREATAIALEFPCINTLSTLRSTSKVQDI